MGLDSEIRIRGNGGSVTVGRRGTGMLTIGIGGSFVIEDPVDGRLFVAPANRSVGMVRVLGETKDVGTGVPTGTIPTALNAGGFLGLGVAGDRVSSAGVATLIIDSGGTVTAALVEISPNGTVFSNGTITAVTVNNAGVINLGFSPGVATFNGALVIKPGGILNIEVFGTADGEFDVVNASSIVFEEGSQLNLVIDESVAGTVAVLEADQIEGTATVTTTVVDESGATVSETTTEDTPVGSGGNELALVIEEGGVTEIMNGAAIDIKPGDAKNKINSKSNAVIVVAMLVSIAPSDVTAATFGPSGAPAIGLAQSDVDGDGDQDLVARFRLGDTGLVTGEARLTITLTDTQLTGCDSVIVK